MSDFTTWTADELRRKTKKLRRDRQQIQHQIELYTDANRWLEERSKREREQAIIRHG